MIRRHRDSWEVVVFAGRDPATGRDRRVSRTVPGTPTQKRPPKEARDLEARLRTEVGQGKHRTTPKVTVGELLDRWMFHAKPGLSPTTVHGYERTIRLYLKPRIGHVRLSRLSTSMLDDLYRSLSTSGGEPSKEHPKGAPLAPATVRQAHAVLRRALDRAVKWEWIDRNPAVHAEPPPLGRRRNTTPGTETLLAVLAAAEATDADLADLVVLACSGARRGEVCGLQWGDVDLEAGLATIRRSAVDIADTVIVKAPKTEGSERTIPLPGFVVERLKARRVRAAEEALACGVGLDPGAFVLSDDPAGVAPLHPNRASDRFRRLVRRLGIPIRLHDLRHATNTLALAAGCAPNDVADYHGHASTKMTLDVYGHAIPAGLQRVAESIDRALSGG